MVLNESLGVYNHISVRRNASALGAEIEGVQISDALKDDQIFDEIIQSPFGKESRNFMILPSA